MGLISSKLLMEMFCAFSILIDITKGLLEIAQVMLTNLTNTEYYQPFVIFAKLIEAQWYVIVVISSSSVLSEVEYDLYICWSITFSPINCLFIYTLPISALSYWFVWALYKLKELALCQVLCKYVTQFVIIFMSFFHAEAFNLWLIKCTHPFSLWYLSFVIHAWSSSILQDY